MTTMIVVPTLGRRPDLLELSLRSITSQELPDLDLVAVGPEGHDIEEKVLAHGGRFVRDPARGGLSGALNAGLAAARPGTRYFSWLGDDDLLTDGSLAATTAALDANPGAVLVFGWCDYIDAAGDVVFRSRAGRVASAILTWGPNLIPQPGCLMRFDAVRAVGGLDESVQLAMDLDLFLRLRRRGQFVALRRTLACFRWHEDSATVKGEGLSMEESDRLRMKYMRPVVARAYEYARWPGRLALWAAKRQVDRNAARRRQVAGPAPSALDSSRW